MLCGHMLSIGLAVLGRLTTVLRNIQLPLAYSIANDVIILSLAYLRANFRVLSRLSNSKRDLYGTVNHIYSGFRKTILP
jgi:hypothetical protein